MLILPTKINAKLLVRKAPVAAVYMPLFFCSVHFKLSSSLLLICPLLMTKKCVLNIYCFAISFYSIEFLYHEHTSQCNLHFQFMCFFLASSSSYYSFFLSHKLPYVSDSTHINLSFLNCKRKQTNKSLEIFGRTLILKSGFKQWNVFFMISHS